MRVLVTAILLLAAAAPAAADDDAGLDADGWLRTGLERYEAGDFAGAVAAFRAGNALDPRPQFLFAIAQAERRRGDCGEAIVYYEQFLASSPPEGQAVAAREQRDRCERALGAAHPAAPTPPPEPAPEAERELPPPPPPRLVETPPWWSDRVTVALAGGAGVLALGGAVSFALAGAAADDAAAATTYDLHAERERAARLRERIGVVALVGAAGLGGVATWRILRGRRRAIEIAPGPGAGIAIGGAW